MLCPQTLMKTPFKTSLNATTPSTTVRFLKFRVFIPLLFHGWFSL